MNIQIIAEAGVNHCGSADMARRMVDVARNAGVDYIKFQTFKTECIVNRSARQADYQRRNLAGQSDDSQFYMLRALELSYDSFSELNDYCRRSGTRFLSTPFDLPSIDFLATLDMDYWKLPSGEITNLPYLRKIAAYRRPVIMSTGMSTPEEIEDAMRVLTDGGLDCGMITLLHCNTEYPTPMADVNLRAMETLRQRFGTRVGYSDHTRGIEVAIAAAALGAEVIEKHFTLDKTLPGPDHVASLDPDELTAMVAAIRNIEAALGDGCKRVTDSERANRTAARKSIVAARDIAPGEIFSESNLTVKRPGNGISPMRLPEIIGQASPRQFFADELIEL
ncbi:MAG: N-acetylneuraminate synthase [Muribaculaceae bacterium]|nr:N-acetylneuraminate synthase [Muribaculaceae bacterium]